jgi:hypothetical protein
MIMDTVVRQAFRSAYRELIAERRRRAPFWMLVGFLPTYIIARFIVRSDPSLSLHVNSVHVHHFTYGIIVLAVVGFLSMVLPQAKTQHWLAVLYGIGLALCFDEFGMWIHLTSNYNLGISNDVMSGLLVFLVIAVYCMGIIRRVLYYLLPQVRSSTKKKPR